MRRGHFAGVATIAYTSKSLYPPSSTSVRLPGLFLPEHLRSLRATSFPGSATFLCLSSFFTRCHPRPVDRELEPHGSLGSNPPPPTDERRCFEGHEGGCAFGGEVEGAGELEDGSEGFEREESKGGMGGSGARGGWRREGRCMAGNGRSLPVDQRDWRGCFR